ncbi:MAG: preprotein translocase subunit SecE [Candidatus Rokubacteria bacterium]|nr:preprotein translocase subunit SecE [Candidatus Rokubacteria bacterium]
MEYLTRIREFFREVSAEFRKVVWPGRFQIVNSTAVVLVVVVMIALFLFFVDIGLSRVAEVVLR